MSLTMPLVAVFAIGLLVAYTGPDIRRGSEFEPSEALCEGARLSLDLQDDSAYRTAWVEAETSGDEPFWPGLSREQIERNHEVSFESMRTKTRAAKDFWCSSAPPAPEPEPFSPTLETRCAESRLQLLLLDDTDYHRTWVAAQVSADVAWWPELSDERLRGAAETAYNGLVARHRIERDSWCSPNPA